MTTIRRMTYCPTKLRIELQNANELTCDPTMYHPWDEHLDSLNSGAVSIGACVSCLMPFHVEPVSN